MPGGAKKFSRVTWNFTCCVGECDAEIAIHTKVPIGADHANLKHKLDAISQLGKAGWLYLRKGEHECLVYCPEDRYLAIRKAG